MKLTKLSRKEMAMIGFSVAKCDDVGDMWNLISRIGDKLGIDAIYGEGYETTVWRACGNMLGYEPDEVPSLNDRICEVVSNIDDDVKPGLRPALWACLRNEDYEAALEILKTPSAPKYEQHIVADSISTIIKQQRQEVLT